MTAAAQPVLLAIETSQRRGGVALTDPAGTVHVETLRVGSRYDDDLIPAIDRVFSRAALVPADLEAIGVSIGPGGFSGLRIAVSTAKMLAETLKARLVAVPSAEVAMASIADPPPGRVLVALGCKRGTLWATVFEDGRVIAASGLEIAAAIDPGGLAAIVADEHLPEELGVRCRAGGVRMLPLELGPGALASVALDRLSAGRTIAPEALVPLYPRPPEAVTIWERRRAEGPQQR